jgi:hypothetical protein
MSDVEKSDQRRTRATMAALAVLATVVLWAVILKFPWFGSGWLMSRVTSLLGFLAAFAAVVNLGYFLHPEIGKPPAVRSGPMSGFGQSDTSTTKRNVMLAAVVFGLLNSALMFAFAVHGSS